MSFLDIAQDLGSYQPEHTVPGGEYKLRVTYADAPEGRSFLIVRIEIVDDPYAKEITRLFNLPGSGRNEKEENRNRGILADFFTACEFNFARQFKPGDAYPEGLAGAEFWGILSDPIDDGKGYGLQNRLSQVIKRK
jgi:hypothetical protein